MTNISAKPRRWGIWAHTQLDASLKGSDDYNALMRAWCPINPRSQFQHGYQVIFGEQQNASFDADVQRRLMKVSYRYQVGKIGLDSDAGWVATVDGCRGDVFVQRFQFEPSKEYPDGSSVEFWHNGLGRIHAYGKWIDQPDNRRENPYVFESEVLSPYASLQPAEQYSWTYHWYACRIGGDFPVVDCTEAGLVSEPLTCRSEGEQVRLRGRLGVFQVGRLVWEATEVGGELLQSDVLVPVVTPREPIVLDQALRLPAQTATLTVMLQDAAGQTIGEIARGPTEYSSAKPSLTLGCSCHWLSERRGHG